MKRFDHSPRKILPEKSKARPPVARPGPKSLRRRLRPIAWHAPVGLVKLPGGWWPTASWPPWRARVPRAGWVRFRRSRLARIVALLAGLSAFGSGTWAATRSPLLDVDHIEVVGATTVPVDAVVAAAGIRTREPMLGVDTAAARARLEAVPWVDRASVERSFPNAVRISVSERAVAAVAVRPAGGFALLDGTGRVLADQSDRPPAVPEIVGAGEAPVPGQWLDGAKPVLAAVLALPLPLRGQVSSAGLTDGVVTLRIGARDVRFGPPENLEAKAAALQALLRHLGNRAVAFIDVRVPSAPVVGPIPSATPAAPATAPAPAGAAPRD